MAWPSSGSATAKLSYCRLVSSRHSGERHGRPRSRYALPTRTSTSSGVRPWQGSRRPMPFATKRVPCCGAPPAPMPAAGWLTHALEQVRAGDTRSGAQDERGRVYRHQLPGRAETGAAPNVPSGSSPVSGSFRRAVCHAASSAQCRQASSTPALPPGWSGRHAAMIWPRRSTAWCHLERRAPISCEDGRTRPTDKAAERALRHALGHDAWMFCGPGRGGQGAAALDTRPYAGTASGCSARARLGSPWVRSLERGWRADCCKRTRRDRRSRDR